MLQVKWNHSKPATTPKLILFRCEYVSVRHSSHSFILLCTHSHVSPFPFQCCLCNTDIESNVRCGTYHQHVGCTKAQMSVVIYIFTANNNNYIELNLIAAVHATQNPVFFVPHFCLFSTLFSLLLCTNSFVHGHQAPSSSSNHFVLTIVVCTYFTLFIRPNWHFSLENHFEN